MDGVTLGIAIVGAATGITGTVVGLIALSRDKPFLAAHQEIRVSDAGTDVSVNLELYVVNNGRQALNVFRAGFATQWNPKRSGRWPWQWRRHPVPTSQVADPLFGGLHGPVLPVRLGPGEHITFTLELISRNKTRHLEPFPRGFAIDTHNNVAWALPSISDDDVRRVYERFDRPMRETDSSA